MSIVSTAPLGMRFADPMTGATVASGLDVAARGPASARFVNARPGAGGVYAFHGLSGLIAVERAERIPGGSTTQVAGDANWWQHHQGKVACEVRVRDPQKRFQPFRFVAPLPHRGLFAPPCAAPPAGVEPFVPLFSAPGRPAPAGMAVVRAELWDRVADRAAAWARLEVWHGATRVGHGFADAEGRAAIYFRPPPFTEAPLVAGQ
ncbi:MAG: hypothetical protein KC620_24370, partial [Myxococcales bacterium]|nr:hypothetical protein [Myxococcales bacterium]